MAGCAAHQVPAGGGGPPLELGFHHLALVTEPEVGVGGWGGYVDTHDARRRMISHAQSPRPGARGRELHMSKVGRAVPLHTPSLSSCPATIAAAVSMRQLGAPVVISLTWKENSGLFISSNGTGTGVRGWGGVGGGRNGVLLPRPRWQCHEAQKSPPDLSCADCPESSWTGAQRGRRLEHGVGGEWHVTVMSGKT